MITIISDYRAIDAEIDRVTKRMPTPAMLARLNAAFNTVFGAIEASVHVKTGSLKSSAKKESSVSKVRQRWEGTITFGGPSTGVHNPVDYAIYEKARGGAHDFIAVAFLMHSLYVAAIKGGLSK